MKKFFPAFGLVFFNLLFSQVDTCWVRIYDREEPVSASVVRMDNSGYIYIGGAIARDETKEDFLLLKYDQNGNLLASAFFNDPTANDSEAITALTLDNEGNVYATGWSKGIGTKTDFLTIKFNSNLETVWVRRLARDSFDYPSALWVDLEGNVYVTGITQLAGINYDYLTLKYSSAGNLVWQRFYAGSDGADDSASALITDNSGNIYVTGYISHNGSPDFLTIKYNPDGETIWTRRYNRASGREDKALLLGLDQSNNLFVVGSTEASSGFYDVGILKYSPSGELLWSKNHNRSGVDDDDLPRALKVDPAGEIYVTGSSWNGSNQDLMILKYDSQGNKLWDIYYDNSATDIGVALALDLYGNLYVGGHTRAGKPDFDLLFLKYSKTGEKRWEKSYRKISEEELVGIGLDERENIYLVGNSAEDIILLKYRPIRDVGVDSILAPSGQFPFYSTRIPKARIINYGGANISFACQFTILRDGNIIYSQRIDTSLSAPDTLELEFPPLLFTIGDTYTAKCSTLLPDDEHPENNLKVSSFVVEPPTPYGWVMKSYLPYGPSLKPVKQGGSLVQVRGRYIYAFKGNNTNEFLKYWIDGDSWSLVCSIPYSLDSRRRVKGGAALTYNSTDSIIYALKGNNTLEFWRYFVNSNTWSQIEKGLPLGYSGRRVKYGSGLVYVRQGTNRYIYFLKGSKTREFYRYHTQGDSWTSLLDVPLGESQRDCKAGSCLARAGDYIYCLKGYYHEFFAYDLANNTWLTKRPLPFENHEGKRRKAKDGAAMAYDGTRRIIYLFKGGNSDEFWGYFVDADTWVELPPIPTSPYNKKVKSGGALSVAGGNVYALKGNRTFEFWMFSWDTTAKSFFGEEEEMPKTSKASPTFANQNPRGLSLRNSKKAHFKVYDLSGRLVKEFRSEIASPENRIKLHLSLPKGIYFLEMDGGISRRKVIYLSSPIVLLPY